MASTSTPRIGTFIAEASITKGKAVKFGAVDENHVVLGALNTDRCKGIAQSTASASGVYLEVALPGGGAKALLGETVVAGNDLVCHTDGTLVLPNNANDEIIARAQEGGVSGDLIAVEVYYGSASASQ